MANRKKVTPKALKKFLGVLAQGGTVTAACALIRTSRLHMYRLRRKDADLAQEWDSAVEEGTDLLEDAAMKRAKHGVLKPVYQGGKRVGYVREYSDHLTALLLKARRPEKFKDRSEVTGAGGHALVPAAPPPLVVNFTPKERS
jgi:hypothetical protein